MYMLSKIFVRKFELNLEFPLIKALEQGGLSELSAAGQSDKGEDILSQPVTDRSSSVPKLQVDGSTHCNRSVHYSTKEGMNIIQTCLP